MISCSVNPQAPRPKLSISAFAVPGIKAPSARKDESDRKRGHAMDSSPVRESDKMGIKHALDSQDSCQHDTIPVLV